MATNRMWDGDLGCLPVLDTGGQVVGMITDRDICMAPLTRDQRLPEIPVSVAMSKEVLSCPPDATLIEAEEIMRSGQVRRLPVIDSDGCLVGIVSLNDLARLAEQEIGRKNRDVSAQEAAATLAAISAPRHAGGGEGDSVIEGAVGIPEVPTAPSTFLPHSGFMFRHKGL